MRILHTRTVPFVLLVSIFSSGAAIGDTPDTSQQPDMAARRARAVALHTGVGGIYSPDRALEDFTYCAARGDKLSEAWKYILEYKAPRGRGPATPADESSAPLSILPEDVLEVVTRYAEAQDAEALCLLGIDYFWRRGDENGETAKRLYLASAERGFVHAMYMLGMKSYNENHLLEQQKKYGNKSNDETPDWTESIRWLSEAADAGHVRAISILAGMYREGQGVSVDPEKAVGLLLEAGALGHARSMTTLAVMNFQGKEIPQDYDEAVRLIHQAVELGDLYGLWLMGYAFEHGKGVAQSNAEALQWYRQSANLGYEWSFNKLASVYRNGELGVAQDRIEAAYWYQKRFLGDLYDDPGPLHDIWREVRFDAIDLYRDGNDAEAHRLFEALLVDGLGWDRGDLSRLWLAMFYATGECGFPQDREQADFIASKVRFGRIKTFADKGTTEETYLLGMAYRYGLGVEQNEETARCFFDAIKTNYMSARLD